MEILIKKALESHSFDFYATNDEPMPIYSVPLFASAIAAGFASPADDYIEEKIDLNKYLVKNPVSTFYARAKGNSMKDANLQSGDLLVIDRSLALKPSSMCICILDGEFTVKYVRREGGNTFLVPCNSMYKEILIEPGRDFEIWGQVIFVIHKVY